MEELKLAIVSAKTWDCSLLCDGTTDHDVPCSIQDIVPFMAEGHVFFSVHQKSSFVFNPSKFLGNDEETKKAMKAHICGAAKASGFKLVTSPASKTARGARLCTLVFVCEHNAEPHEIDWSNDSDEMLQPGIEKGNEKKRKKSRNSTGGKRRKVSTVRPCNELERCHFKISVFCDKTDKKWYLSYSENPQCGQHCGHMKLSTNAIATSMKYMSSKKKETLTSCMNVNLNNSTCAKVVNANSELCDSVGPRQMENFRNKLKTTSMSVQLFGRNASSAEKLIELFDTSISNGEKLHYVAMTHSNTSGLQIRLPKGRPKRKINDSCEC